MVLRQDDGWEAVAGNPLGSRRGHHKLYVDRNGSDQMITFLVEPKQYKEQYLTIKNRHMVNPTAEELKRIHRELGVIKRALRGFRPLQDVSTHFSLPVAGPVSSTFGLRRFFNGQPRKPHSGLDLAVTAGSQIKAPAAGRISATGNLEIQITNYFLNIPGILEKDEVLLTLAECTLAPIVSLSDHCPDRRSHTRWPCAIGRNLRSPFPRSSPWHL